MLNGRVILFGILCVLFVADVFGQGQSDPNIITVSEKINISNLNNNVKELGDAVKKLTEITEKLSGNVEKLTESVNSLNTRVAVLEERTQGTAKTVHVILASIIAPLVVAIIAPIVYYILTQKILNRRNKNDTASTQVAQANQSEAASTSTSSLGFPSDRKEVKELLKAYSPATEEKS